MFLQQNKQHLKHKEGLGLKEPAHLLLSQQSHWEKGDLSLPGDNQVLQPAPPV